MIRLIWRIIDKYICIPLIIIIGVIDTFCKLIKSKNNSNNDYKKILIIKLSALGDTIMMIPLIREMRNKMPKTEIYALVTEINIGALKTCPYIDTLRLLNFNNPADCIKTLVWLRKQRFDLVVDFEQRVRISALIAYFLSPGIKTGFKTKGYSRHYLYTKKITHRRDWHEAVCMAALIKDITGEIVDYRPEFWILDADKHWANIFIDKNNLAGKKLIAIHPGCGARHLKGARAREWPKENFALLADTLAKTYDAYILLTGGKDEIFLTETIASLMNIKPLILAGKIDIGKLAAILERCALFISGDTGIMHLASALGLRTISIFGPTDENRCMPLIQNRKIIYNRHLKCRPCQIFGIDNPRCSKYECINSITVAEILKHVILP